MDFLSVIIDRIGATNVFNIVQGRLPSRDTHLQTVVDDDLISEFLIEVERIARIATGYSGPDQAAPVGISGELRRIGETFFLQFFPEAIQKRLRDNEHGFLFLHVDHSLRNIPWELLHDGNCFLADKFYIGKNVSGYWRDTVRAERDRLRVLIIADPTEDLEWARLEGEGLFDSLNAEISPDLLDVHFLAGSRITKLGLLNAIKDRDIIHYTGHLYYDANQQESGWLLAGNKVLRAREIEKSGCSPFLVFSNSCLSSPLSGGSAATPADGAPDVFRFNDMAGAFLKAGIGNYIGTNWEIEDNVKTLEFSLNFYRSMLEVKSLGEALYEARSKARHSYSSSDITWANYVLHGNPMARIFRQGKRRTFDASRNAFNARRVIENYPTPVAHEYDRFRAIGDVEFHPQDGLEALILSFEHTMLVVGALTFGNYRFLTLRGVLPEREDPCTLSFWIEKIYECTSNMRSLHIDISVTGVMECLYLHRDSIFKLLRWTDEYRRGAITGPAVGTHFITYQFLFDNLLTDLAALSRYRIAYVDKSGETALVFKGMRPEQVRLVPAEFKIPPLLEKFLAHRDQVVIYNSSRKVFFTLDDFLEFDPVSGRITFPCYEKPAPFERADQEVPRPLERG